MVCLDREKMAPIDVRCNAPSMVVVMQQKERGNLTAIWYLVLGCLMFAIRLDISYPIFGGYKEPASAMFSLLIALSDCFRSNTFDFRHKKFSAENEKRNQIFIARK